MAVSRWTEVEVHCHRRQRFKNYKCKGADFPWESVLTE